MRIEADEDEAKVWAWRGPTAIGLPLRLAAAAAVIAGLALIVHAPGPRAPGAPLQASAEAPALVGLAPLRLDEPGIDPVRVEPGRIDPRSGLREDALGRGSFTAIEAPVLRLAVTRGSGAGRMPSLFVLVARRAARADRGEMPLSVLRAGGASAVATRFGTAEIAPMTLAGPLTRTCTGFVVAQADLRIDGFLCAPLGGAAEPRAVACTLDALGLDDPADPTATAAFRQARDRSACESLRMTEADAAGRTGSVTARRASTKN